MGEIISRLFGNSSSKRDKIGRLIFRDAFLSNKDKLDSLGAKIYTEVKFEIPLTVSLLKLNRDKLNVPSETVSLDLS